MTDTKQVMQQALDALCLPCDRWNGEQTKIINAAIEALRGCLTAPAAEPEPQATPIPCAVHVAGRTFEAGTSFCDVIEHVEATRLRGGVPEPRPRPHHVFNVVKNGSLTEWEPTTHAFALPDGKHALYTAAPQAPAPELDAGVVRDAERYRWLRDQHEGHEDLSYDADDLPQPLTPTALAFTVFKPDRGSLEPVGCIPGELDKAIDAAMSAQGGGK